MKGIPASSSNDLKREWQECCSLVLEYEIGESGFEEAEKDQDIVLVSLLEDDEEEAGEDHSTDDAWMANAHRINDSLNKIMEIIERKKDSYLQPHTDDEASLLESTVLSFVATAANQIEALQQSISSSNRDYIQHCMGIVGYLMVTLKEGIANPFAKMQKQRARPAISLWENPVQCRLVRRLSPLDDDDDDQEQRFLPTGPRPSPSYDFLDTYQIGDDMRNHDAHRPSSIFQAKQPQAISPPTTNQKPTKMNIPIKNIEQPVPHQSSKTIDEEDREYENILQQEVLLLTATLQNDLDSVQQVEARMSEITALLAQFSNLVSEQQMEITTIHESTVQSKKNVEKGHDHLVDAAERVKKSRHYLAIIVTSMALLLLFFNFITR